MTKNQIDYFKAKEDKRHNLATETELERSNKAREFETNRSNSVIESETNRHNLAIEGIQHHTNVINQAHLERMDTETQRSNMAREDETQRHNIASESETTRHNYATEQENALHNRTTENLTFVHNAVTEGIERDRANAYGQSVQISDDQLGINKQLAEYKGREVATAELKALYETRLNQARTDNTKTQTKYLHQENTRDWVDTVSNAVYRGTSSTKNIVDSFNSVINAVSGIGKIVRAIK